MGAHALATAAGMKDEGILTTEPLLMRLLNFDLITHTPFRPLEGLILVTSPCPLAAFLPPKLRFRLPAALAVATCLSGSQPKTIHVEHLSSTCGLADSASTRHTAAAEVEVLAGSSACCCRSLDRLCMQEASAAGLTAQMSPPQLEQVCVYKAQPCMQTAIRRYLMQHDRGAACTGCVPAGCALAAYSMWTGSESDCCSRSTASSHPRAVLRRYACALGLPWLPCC